MAAQISLCRCRPRGRTDGRDAIEIGRSPFPSDCHVGCGLAVDHHQRVAQGGTTSSTAAFTVHIPCIVHPKALTLRGTASMSSSTSPDPPTSPTAPLAPFPPLPPAEYRSRAPEFYGFVAWTCTYIIFVLYLLWALLPDEVILWLGVDWYPNRSVSSSFVSVLTERSR